MISRDLCLSNARHAAVRFFFFYRCPGTFSSRRLPTVAAAENIRPNYNNSNVCLFHEELPNVPIIVGRGPGPLAQNVI